MKLLYLTFQENSVLYAGVIKKIKGQSAAFAKLGFNVTYSLWSGNFFHFYGANPGTVPISAEHGVMNRFYEIAIEHLEHHSYDILYVRLDRIDFGVIRLFQHARTAGIQKIIVEIPNYPYLDTYRNSYRFVKNKAKRAAFALKVNLRALEDQLAGPKLRGLCDAVILYGDHTDSFYGVKAMNATNGINCDALPAVPWPKSGPVIQIIGVAGTLWWQAYDRVLRGMQQYYQENKNPQFDFHFTLVGGDAKEMPEFRKLVTNLNLQDRVEMPGFQTGKNLQAYYNRSDVGISTIGCFRRGITRCSSLKAREYAAVGLPFLYAYDDESLPGDVAWALRVPNNDTPIDMEQLAQFVLACRSDPRTVMQEREFSEMTYDWTAILHDFLEFAGFEFPPLMNQR
ncbi:MAG: glycosyltransferase [Oscillospiraceae bacterium]|nr:glycosyltransferase [Oscillospiraceae bacterium]